MLVCTIFCPYVAASSEWVAPLMMMMTPAVGFGEAGALSPYVAMGIFIIVAMHIYINLHMPTFDVWMLNFTPAYMVYNAFYCNKFLPEPGFDWAGFGGLALPYQAFCALFLAYCIYGHCFPEHMTYMFCYRFWAGNWPMAWVLISESGFKKLLKTFPKQAAAGNPGDLLAKTMGPAWAISLLGVFLNAQLPNRAMPMVLHKALKHSAKARGVKPVDSLGQFVQEVRSPIPLTAALLPIIHITPIITPTSPTNPTSGGAHPPALLLSCSPSHPRCPCSLS